MNRNKPKLVNLDKFYEGLLDISAFDNVPYDDLRELIAKSEVNAYYPDEVIAMLEDLKKTIDSKVVQGDELFDDEDRWGYGQGYQSADVDTCDIIQARINELKGDLKHDD